MRPESRNVLWRGIAATVVGLIVAATTYLCAYWVGRASPLYHQYARRTYSDLRQINDAVEDHWRNTGRWPASLTDIEKVKSAFRLDDSGRVIDGWNHPYEYGVEGDSFTLVSYGRDGQPGGEGEDADIDLDHPHPPPTLREFTFDLPTAGILYTSLLSGVCAGVVCVLPRRDRRPPNLLVRIVAATVGAILIGTWIALMHASGH